MIRTILIDDERNSRDALQLKLETHCPDVLLLACCDSAESGIAAIREHRPELVFLDIEMPNLSGFGMLEQLGTVPFQVIFTTAYNEYAIRAIRFNAMDYLLKPIDTEELKSAVGRFEARQPAAAVQQIQLFLQSLQSPQKAIAKIALPTLEGLIFVETEKIIRLESDGNYTSIFLQNKSRLFVSKTLKEFEDLLEPNPSFLRVHHSHIVNMNFVSKYIKGEGGTVVMEDGSEVDVASRRKADFLRHLNRV